MRAYGIIPLWLPSFIIPSHNEVARGYRICSVPKHENVHDGCMVAILDIRTEPFQQF